MKTRFLASTIAIALGISFAGHAYAQHDHSQHHAGSDETASSKADASTHAGHDHADAAQMDHSGMDHSDMDHSAMGHAGMDHSTHAATQQPREPIPALTDADRTAAFPQLKSHDMKHGPALHSLVLFNRLEAWDADPGLGQAWEGQAWIGGDLNRLWLRSEGERMDGRTGSVDLEVLYGRSVSPWWDMVAGVKHDFLPGDSQTWAAFGVQGMAPYKFEVAATAYVGESGRMAATVEAEYELLLTNRLILQPLVEVRFNSQDDPQRHVGSGLSKAEAGLRLRYEFTRRFAPYIGITHERSFGRTADFHRQEGDGVRDTRLVAGIRMWF